MLWRKKDNRKIFNFITLPNLRPHFSQLSFTPWRCLQSQHSIVTTSSLLMIYMKNTCFRGLSVLKLCSKISQKCCSPRKSVVLGLVVTKPAAVEPVAARCLWILIFNILFIDMFETPLCNCIFYVAVWYRSKCQKWWNDTNVLTVDAESWPYRI